MSGELNNYKLILCYKITAYGKAGLQKAGILALHSAGLTQEGEEGGGPRSPQPGFRVCALD